MGLFIHVTTCTCTLYTQLDEGEFRTQLAAAEDKLKSLLPPNSDITMTSSNGGEGEGEGEGEEEEEEGGKVEGECVGGREGEGDKEASEVAKQIAVVKYLQVS